MSVRSAWTGPPAHYAFTGWDTCSNSLAPLTLKVIWNTTWYVIVWAIYLKLIIQSEMSIKKSSWHSFNENKYKLVNFSEMYNCFFLLNCFGFETLTAFRSPIVSCNLLDCRRHFCRRFSESVFSPHERHHDLLGHVRQLRHGLLTEQDQVQLKSGPETERQTSFSGNKLARM